jgi:hypothetical protein
MSAKVQTSVPPGRTMESVSRAIERERLAWRDYCSRTPGGGIDPQLFPELWGLYSAGKRLWAAEPVDSNRNYFFYFGRRYGWAVTTLGRFKVWDLKTREIIVQGPPGVMPDFDANEEGAPA